MNQEESPFKFFSALAGIAGGAIGMIGAGKRKRQAERREAKSRAEMEQQKQAFMSADLSNPFANMQNQFAGMQNQFAGLENTMEDLTVNQQQAQFEAQQGQQQQANIMEGMRGAAGGSGIAALAQQMAKQGQLQTQQASASIGAQEAANQKAAAAQAGQLQELQAQGAADVDLQMRQGAADVDRQVAAGEQVAQQRELDRTATLLGMSQAETAAYQEQAQQAQMQKQQGLQDIIGGVGQGLSMLASDRKLKKNIKLIGKSPSGLNIYLFEYIDKAFGCGIFQGVMSDEIPKDAVVKHTDGYDTVDYSKLDVEFKNII